MVMQAINNVRAKCRRVDELTTIIWRVYSIVINAYVY